MTWVVYSKLDYRWSAIRYLSPVIKLGTFIWKKSLFCDKHDQYIVVIIFPSYNKLSPQVFPAAFDDLVDSVDNTNA